MKHDTTEKERILIIDDELAIRQSYSDFLSDLNYETYIAENGRIGLEIFTKEQIDLVLVDLRMPEVDGLEVLARIKEISPNTPLIVISGTGVIRDAVEALRKGAWDYLLKPIEDFSILNHAISKALEKARLIKENQEYQDHLEELVEARTCELKKTNHDLVHEINERKKTECELITALKRAQESDRLKTVFLNNLSHEIRTPMNGILGFISLLLDSENTGEEQKTYQDYIKISSKRMLNTVSNLMDISMIESKNIKLDIAEIKISVELQAIYHNFKNTTQIKGLDFKLNNQIKPFDDTIFSDQNKLQAILSHLIDNAIKFTSEGTIEFGCKKSDDNFHFYVKDSGTGIPKKRQQAIFDRFVKADLDELVVVEGLGVGLSIAKAYVELMGGDIWVESLPKEGAQINFILPEKAYGTIPAEIESPQPTNNIQRHEKSLKILIVDDDVQALSYLSILLKSIANEILQADDGIQAVDLAQKNNDIDLILMDIKMPGLNGYEATQKIREFNKDVLIIAQTAYVHVEDCRKATEAGCDDYISKPIEKSKLFQIIKKYYTIGKHSDD